MIIEFIIAVVFFVILIAHFYLKWKNKLDNEFALAIRHHILGERIIEPDRSE